VTPKKIKVDYIAVPDPAQNPKGEILPPYDSVTVDL
jgi:hypothetical protein